jgi:hypothetical protein
MHTFFQWLGEARYQPEEEHSWVWHPFYGAHSERGYMQHTTIFKRHPELQKLPHHEHGQETVQDYDPPRGTVRVDRSGKKLYYSRYDQSKFGIAGTSDSADSKEVDQDIRHHFNVPSDFKSVIHSKPIWWHNTQGMAFVQ